LGVAPKLEQGLGRCSHQQSEDVLAIEINHSTQLGRHREDNVKMADGQDALLAPGNPFVLRQRLTVWTISVAAGVELVNDNTTIFAHALMPTERGSPASLNGTHD